MFEFVLVFYEGGRAPPCGENEHVGVDFMDYWDIRPENQNSDSAIKSLQRFLKTSGKGFIIAVIVVLLGFWLATGVYSVGPGEQAVIRQFGKMVHVTGPGLRYRLPWPIQQHDLVDVSALRSAEIGYRTVGGTTVNVSEEALMLTGDENIVRVHMFVQYRVKDAAKFLFSVRDPEETLRIAAEVALRSAVGQNTVDQSMTDGRAVVESQITELLQELLDTYGTGISLSGVKLLVVDPPEQVKDAFHDVVRAWEDKERLVQEAEGYRADLLPRARGEAQAMIQEAEAYRERRILEAQGDVANFVLVRQEYEKAKEVTRERLYLETIQEILSKTNNILIKKDLGNGVVQFLPLSGFAGSLYDGQSR